MTKSSQGHYYSRKTHQAVLKRSNTSFHSRRHASHISSGDAIQFTLVIFKLIKLFPNTQHGWDVQPTLLFRPLISGNHPKIQQSAHDEKNLVQTSPSSDLPSPREQAPPLPHITVLDPGKLGTSKYVDLSSPIGNKSILSWYTSPQLVSPFFTSPSSNINQQLLVKHHTPRLSHPQTKEQYFYAKNVKKKTLMQLTRSTTLRMNATFLPTPNLRLNTLLISRRSVATIPTPHGVYGTPANFHHTLQLPKISPISDARPGSFIWKMIPRQGNSMPHPQHVPPPFAHLKRIFQSNWVAAAAVVDSRWSAIYAGRQQPLIFTARPRAKSLPTIPFQGAAPTHIQNSKRDFIPIRICHHYTPSSKTCPKDRLLYRRRFYLKPYNRLLQGKSSPNPFTNKKRKRLHLTPRATTPKSVPPLPSPVYEPAFTTDPTLHCKIFQSHQWAPAPSGSDAVHNIEFGTYTFHKTTSFTIATLAKALLGIILTAFPAYSRSGVNPRPPVCRPPAFKVLLITSTHSARPFHHPQIKHPQLGERVASDRNSIPILRGNFGYAGYFL
ncbi:hypothetical protein DFS34DRAFT_653515 [Phlyctochytrium arcticum]|nr:hypothetical protein DFS34DRAFT_653515 [Phlyctochytrium arcticum]